MQTLPIDATTRLTPAHHFQVSDSLAQSIVVHSGAIWITQARAPRDIVATAGQVIEIDHPQAAIIAAIGGPAIIETHTLAALPAEYAAAA